MADSVRVKYGQGAVFGSLAYDYNNPELYPEFAPSEPVTRPVEREEAAPQTREKAAVKAVARSAQSIAPGAILGYAIAAVLIILALLAQIRLTGVAAEAAGLESELASLQQENDKLLIRYESSFNLAEVEEYAVGVLEMQKPRTEQVRYIDGVTTDRAVILEESKEQDTLLNRVEGFLFDLREYLN